MDQLPNEPVDLGDKQLLAKQPDIFPSTALIAEPCTDAEQLFKSNWTLRVLYIFAGKERQSDVRSHLEDLQHKHIFLLIIKEVDIVRDPSLDVTDKKLVDSLLLEIDSQNFDIVIVTPPVTLLAERDLVESLDQNL